MVQAAIVPLGDRSFGILFFALIVIAWAIVRPSTLRDDDGRRLPGNATARTFLIFFYLFSYLVLVGLVQFFGDGLSQMMRKLSGLIYEVGILRLHPSTEQSVPFSQSVEAPHIAFIFVVFLLTMRPVRDIEARFLIWAHGASNYSEESVRLARHLSNCGFVPSDLEVERNIDWVRPYNLYVTDNAASPAKDINLGSIVLWNKTSALLRLIKGWNTGTGRSLNSRETALLAELEAAHERKTKLATQIIGFLVRSGGSNEAVNRVTGILEGASRADPRRAGEIEGQIGAIIGGAADTQQRIELGSEQLETYLRPINEYFLIEYRIIIDQMSKLAAKSVLLSGDTAPERLESLKQVGFDGLGRVEPFNINNILRTFLIVGLGGFLVFWLFVWIRTRLMILDGIDATLARTFGRHMLSFVAGITIVMSVATLIGALFGSRTFHMRQPHPPWRYYLASGACAVIGFFVIHFAQISYFGRDPGVFAQLRQQIEEAREKKAQATSRRPPVAVVKPPPVPVPARPLTLATIAPMAILPFMISVGICLLARAPNSLIGRLPVRHAGRRAALERTIDAVAMAFLLALGCLLALAIGKLTGFQPPRPVVTNGPPPELLLILNFMALGLLIGATVVRDTRNAAHTQMVVPEAVPGPREAVPAALAQPA